MDFNFAVTFLFYRSFFALRHLFYFAAVSLLCCDIFCFAAAFIILPQFLCFAVVFLFSREVFILLLSFYFALAVLFSCGILVLPLHFYFEVPFLFSRKILICRDFFCLTPSSPPTTHPSKIFDALDQENNVSKTLASLQSNE